MSFEKQRAVHAELNRILSSGYFAQARVQSRFLSYVVLQALEGQNVSEKDVASEVFGRGPGDFDSAIDSVVRVNASKIRAKLQRYYGEPANADSRIRIELPPHGYNPEFIESEAVGESAPLELDKESDGRDGTNLGASAAQPGLATPPEPRPDAALPLLPVEAVSGGRNRLVLTGVLGLVAAGAIWAVWRRDDVEPPNEMKPITFDAGETSDPAWSANGRWLVYSSNRAGDSRDIWLEDRQQQGTAIRLTSHSAIEMTPDISPDGSEVVYRSSREGGGIYLVKTTGGLEVLLAPGGFAPRFSPDGSRIAYVAIERGGSSLYIMDLKARNSRLIAPNVSEAACPVWLPSGKSILFRASRASKQADWYVTPVDYGGPVAQWPTTATGASAMAPPKDLFDRHETCPATAFEDRIIFNARGQIWSIAFDGSRIRGEPRNLATGPNLYGTRARWAAKGRLELICAAARGETHIWSLPLDIRSKAAGPLQRLTADLRVSGGLRGTRPALSPDGRWLYYEVPGAGNRDILRKDLNSGDDAKSLEATEIYESDVMAGPNGQYAFERSVGKTCLFYLKSPTMRERLICRDCGYPKSMSGDGTTVLFHVPPQLRIADVASGRAYELPGEFRGTVYASLSQDGKWVVAGINAPGQSGMQAVVFPSLQTGLLKRIEITQEPYNLNPIWNFQGDGIFYMSQRDGRRCLYLQRVDSESKMPKGEPEAVHHFHDTGPYPWNGAWMAVDSKRLAMNLGQNMANLWTIQVSAE